MRQLRVFEPKKSRGCNARTQESALKSGYSSRTVEGGFFFQAEDGIRDADVTGVQTCALPISLCAVMLMGNMIVAILTNRIGSIHGSGLLAWLDNFLYLPEVLYVLLLFWLLFSGPGPYSVDSMMARWEVSPASRGH